MTCAIWQPVTNANDAVCGEPEEVARASRPQPRSQTAADGPPTYEAGVLVPGGRQPVRRERGRERAADHEPEVAAARDSDDARLGGGGESLDHVERIARLLREWAAERGAQLVDGRRRPDRALVEGLDEVRRDLGRSPKQLSLVAHGASVRSVRHGSIPRVDVARRDE